LFKKYHNTNLKSKKSHDFNGEIGKPMIYQSIQLLQHSEKIPRFNQQSVSASNSTGVFSDMIKDMVNCTGNNNQLTNFLPEDLKHLEMHQLVELLRKHLLSKGISLDEASVNNKGLIALEKFLVGAGFNKSGVSSIMEKLKTDVKEKGSLKLSKLFANLNGLEDKKTDKNKENWLEISALPYIESILSCFGVDFCKIDSVLADAKIEGRGIDLSRLVSNLKKELQNILNGKEVRISKESQSKVSMLMDRIGMGSGNKQRTVTTFEGFVSQLEAMVDHKSGKSSSNKILAEDLNRFMENIKTDRNIKGENIKINLSEKVTESAKLSGLFDKKSDNHNEKPIEPENLSKGLKSLLSKKVLYKTMDDKSSNNEQEIFSADNVVRETISLNKASAVLRQDSAHRLPGYVIDQVNRRILRARISGASEIRLQLKPPELGRLQIRINGSEDMLKISIVTENQASGKLLQVHRGELKSLLADQGMHPEKLDVQITHNFDQSMAGNGHGSNAPQGRRRRLSNIRNDQEESKLSIQELSGTAVQKEGILDLVA